MPHGEKGFIVLTVLLLFVILASLVGVYLFLSTQELRQVDNSLEIFRALSAAEAGAAYVKRSLIDDILAQSQNTDPAQHGYYAYAAIDPFNSPVGASAFKDNKQESLKEGQGVRAGSFGEIVNILSGRLNSLQAGLRIKINRPSYSARVDINYTTDNWNTTRSLARDLEVTNTNWLNLLYDIDLSWAQVKSPDFSIEILVKSTSNKNARLEVDHIFLRPFYEIDSSLEQAVNGFEDLKFGDAIVSRAQAFDESGKVHLNYSNELFLVSIMEKAGIPLAQAQSFAAQAVNYRSNKFFDFIEELKAATGMSNDYFSLIKDHSSVYSYINENVLRPESPRAPININTASQTVLTALLEPLGLGSSAAVLAADIIASRESEPFTHMQSSNTEQGKPFYPFLVSRSYLNAAEIKRVAENVDASSRDWSSDLTAGECLTAEFSYSSRSAFIRSIARSSNATVTVEKALNDDGSEELATYLSDPVLEKYWRQFE